MSTDDRLVEVEVRIAEQEKTIEELSAVVTDQWKEIDQLSKKVTALTNRFLLLEEQTASDIPITKPPHW